MPHHSRGMSEDTRYKVYRIGAHMAWWGSFSWLCLLTYVNITHEATQAPSAFQRISGLGIIFLMGVAIALGLALSRMRLARTISSVFKTGMEIADQRQEDLKEWTKKRERPPTDSSTT